MYSFTICLLILVVGYFVYGRYVERVFGPEAKRPTPALTKADGMDYIPLPTWKIFMIQFLNIAGLGPIFGAIMGAKFGTASYLWIVLGSVLAGATHDYFSGMLSIRTLSGDDHQAGDAWFYSNPDGVGGSGFRCRACRFAG